MKISVSVSAFLLSTAMIFGTANAATISFSDSIALADTNWTENLNLFQFDSSLGTLSQVDIILSGNVEGLMQVENFSTTSTSHIISELKATINLDWASGGSITQILPIDTDVFDATTFDGISDFGGTSGRTTSGYATDQDTVSYTASDSVFADFIGSGTLSFNVYANSVSMAQASGGSVFSGFETAAAADVTIIYTYDTDPVPEPATMLLFGAGFLGLAGTRFRGKKN